MTSKGNVRSVRKFILIISLLHIILGITAVNLAAFSVVGGCQKNKKLAGAWGSLASLICASVGLTLTLETKRKFVLVYICIQAFTVITAALQLAVESVGLEIEGQYCQDGRIDFARRQCKLECVKTHFYLIVTALATLLLSLFSSLILSHSLRMLSDS